MKKFLFMLCVMCVVGFTGGIGYAGCTSPTDEFPPECPLESPTDETVTIPVIGPQVGTLEFKMTILPNVGTVVRTPCANVNCNCEIEVFESTLDIEITGTGDLAAYQRSLALPIQCEVHSGPRNPDDPVQTFETEMVALNLLGGPLTGDPDFGSLNIVAGESNGLPSPGSTKVKKQPTGDFAVDSFFDITYRIEFTGAPGSPLEDL